MKWRYQFSPTRFVAIVAKEFVQMRRDRLTFAMMVGVPLLQLILFGFAINADPKHLPAAVRLADYGPHGRSVLQAIRNSGYYDFVREVQTEEEADQVLARGEVLFVVTIPENFSRDLIRWDPKGPANGIAVRPVLLVEADATDPAVTSNAISSLNTLVNTALQNDLKGVLADLAATDPPIELRVHARYNPEVITQYNIVPGLLGVVLTMTMVMITGLAITRERERGTMENLLSMPTRPFEVLFGKIIPYILVGYIQVGLILVVARFLFRVPVEGSLILLLGAVLLFILANLAVGVTFSTLAQNQLQAVQMAFFFFLPSILLSGFAFPFKGMPVWAQVIGQILPNTHFLRVVRGILIKGNGLEAVAPELWPIALFAVVALIVGVTRYHRTLD